MTHQGVAVMQDNNNLITTQEIELELKRECVSSTREISLYIRGIIKTAEHCIDEGKTSDDDIEYILLLSLNIIKINLKQRAKIEG